MEKFEAPFKQPVQETLSTDEIKDLIESQDFGPEINKAELGEAMGWIYDCLVNGKLIGREEEVADEVLQAMRTFRQSKRDEKSDIEKESHKKTSREIIEEKESDNLWLVKSQTGQLTLSFLRELVHRKDSKVQNLKQFAKLDNTQQREMIDWLFGSAGKRSILSITAEFIDGFKKTGEFILPVKHLGKLPDEEVLTKPREQGGYGFYSVYFNAQNYRLIDALTLWRDFDVTDPRKQQDLIDDLKSVHTQRFPVCQIFDIVHKIKSEHKKLNASEVFKKIVFSEPAYLPVSIDHALAYAKYGWDSRDLKTQMVAVLGSGTIENGSYRFSYLYIGGLGPYLGMRGLDEEWRDYHMFLAVRK